MRYTTMLVFVSTPLPNILHTSSLSNFVKSTHKTDLLTDFNEPIGPFDNVIGAKLNGCGEALREPLREALRETLPSFEAFCMDLSDSRDVGRTSRCEGLNRPGSDRVDSSTGARDLESKDGAGEGALEDGASSDGGLGVRGGRGIGSVLEAIVAGKRGN